MSTPTRSFDHWPRWARVRQALPGEAIADIPAAVAAALAPLRLEQRVRPGERVAISAGSRGIANLPAITAAAVAEVRRRGGEPFIFPAMGSHGGATPDGQRQVLAGYGITDDAVGAPVLCQPDVVRLGETESGIPLFCDRLAAEAQHVLIINRVKPHTDFTGPIESGPTKMLAIGVGKRPSAVACHQRVVDRGYSAVIKEVGDAMWARLPLLGALAPVENGYHQTTRIGAIRPESHEADEAALLEHAREVFGYLPVEHLHVLVVDELGKDVSGTGMDPNVTGTDCAKTHRPTDKPFIWRILVRGLTAGTHGNATGLGNADYCLRRCAEAIDWHATKTNTVTAASPEVARCPVVCENDVDLLDCGLATVGQQTPQTVRLLRIANTLRVDEFLASEALLPELSDHPRCEVVSEPAPIRVDADGFLTDSPVSR